MGQASKSTNRAHRGRVWLSRVYTRFLERWPVFLLIGFVRTLATLALWMTIPGIVLLLSAWYQAGEATRSLPAHHVLMTLNVPQSADGPLLLSIDYPRKLFLESTAEPTAHIAMWLVQATPTSGPAVESTLTSAPGPASTYTLEFTPTTGLLFTDAAGNPALPVVALTPAPAPGTPIMLYIRPGLAPRTPERRQVHMLFSGPGVVATPTAPVLTLELESAQQSRWRHLCKALTGTGSLVATLVSALVGFGVQQWLQIAEEERKRQNQQLQEARVAELKSLITSDLSEAARFYLKYQAEREVGERVTEQWEDAAPDMLRLLVTLLEGSEQERQKLNESQEQERIQEALSWGWQALDGEWRGKIADFLSSNTRYSSESARRVLCEKMLYLWTDFTLWSPRAAWSGQIERGLQVLGLKDNPFGTGKAEEERLLTQCPFPLPASIRHLREPGPALILGREGHGKTTAALLYMLDSLQLRDTFPVYWRPGVAEFLSLRIQDVANMVAGVLLTYLAALPTTFCNQNVEGRAAIAYLLTGRFGAGAGLVQRFYQAGLPRTGAGNRLLEEVEALTRGSASPASVSESELLALLSKGRPAAFPHTTLLLDVQVDRQRVSRAGLSQLLELLELLGRRGVFVKAFLPAEIFEKPLRSLKKPVMPEQAYLEWPEDELRSILTIRLRHFGYDSLNQWCVPSVSFPDQSVFRAAGGSPRRLMELGNALLARIGEKGSKLTGDDLTQMADLWK